MKRIFVLLTLIMVLAVISSAALAGPPENVAGDWYYHPRLDELETVKIVGGNTFLWTVEDSRWNGSFQGSEDCMAIPAQDCAASVDYGDVIFYRSGRGFFKGVVEFAEVTVHGKTGTLQMKVNGSRPDPFTDWTGHWVIADAGKQLKGLQGQGTWWGPGWQEIPGEWGIIHYQGKVHFE